MKRLFFVVVWCAALSFSSPLFSQTTDEESSLKSELSEAERREIQVVDRFWSLLERSPRRGTSLDRVYGYYVDTGRSDELLERCLKLTDENPEDGRYWLLHGLILSRRSDDAATIDALEKATKFDPENPLASFYLGEAYIAQGRLKDAADALEISVQSALNASKTRDAANATSAKDILAILQTLGRVYERFGDREKSARVWNTLEELFPGDTDILVRIAETLEEEGQFDEAFKRYRTLADMSKDDRFARVQYTLAASDIKIRLGDKQGAIDDFEKLLEELAGESWLAQSIRDRVERIFVRQADYAGLAGYYQKRLQKHPNELETVRRLAVALVRLSRTEEAEKLLTIALEKAPSNIPLRLALIDLLVADKKFGEIDKHYAKIDEIEPNNPDHVSQWGLVVMEDGRLDETQRKASATKIWTRLVDAKPNDPSVAVMVAELFNSSKIFDEAEKYYQRAIELRPLDPTYKEYLGYFYYHRERKTEAVAMLKKIAEGDRRTPSNLAQLGGIFKSLGYMVEAIDAMQNVVLLAPDDFELRMQFADMLALNDQPGQADGEFLAAEKLAQPLSEEFARFLQGYTKLLQSTMRLNDAVDSLQAKLNGPPAEIGTTIKPAEIASDYWRLAVYETARGRSGMATDAIERAMQLVPKSNLLLEAAANIFDKGNDQVKAAEIYEKLAASDPQRRVDHLKRLANIQRELGEMNRAIETARLVMATGSGNAVNSRFYADMLLGIGRRKDGIEALRRAVRLDPTDTTTLSALAEVLFDSGQTDEALEILWRIFDRTEDLSGKIALVGRMSNYYQEAQRFDQLIERLRKNSNDPASRRETAYCLAQAYVSVSDYEAARQTLEMLLLGGNADGENQSSQTTSDDTLLLSQLSKIAELQGDLPTAIRYQEMLCDRLQSGQQAGQENERLLSLYQQIGDKDKAIGHLLDYFVSKGKLHEQIRAIDDFLARSDYASAEKILKRIESKTPDHWELLYRRLMLDYWLGRLDEAEATARQLIVLETSRDEESAKMMYEKSKIKPFGQSDNRQGSSQRYSRYSGGRSPWGFGEHGYYNHYYGGNTGSAQEIWQRAVQPLTMTLFRDKLQLERYYYHQSSVSNVEPAKPQYEPENFGDSQFASQLWLLKIAMQRDLNEFREQHPIEEGKAELAATDANGFKLKRFEKAIDDLRASLPVDGKATTQTLLDRLRLEYFFTLFYERFIQQNQSSFPECNYAKLLFTLKDDKNAKDPTEPRTVHVDLVGQAVPVHDGVIGAAATQSLRSEIEQELGLRGEKEWRLSAYDSILSQIASEAMLKLLDRYDLEKEFDTAVAKLPQEEAKKFSENDIAELRNYFLTRYEMLRKKWGEERAKDLLTEEQKFDWILQCWKEAIDSTSLSSNHNNYYQVFSFAPRLLKTLEPNEPLPVVAKLRELIQKGVNENSAVAMIIAQSEVSSLALQTDSRNVFILISKTFPDFGQELQQKLESADKEEEKEKIKKSMKLLIALTADDDSETMSFNDRFETFKTAIERYKQAALRVRDEVQKTKSSSAMQTIPWQHLLSPQQFGNFFQTQMNRSIAQVHKILQPGKDNAVEYHIIEGVQVPVYQSVPVMGIPLVDESKKNEQEKPKTKLSQKQLEQIATVDKDYYRVLDYYFDLMNELDGLSNKESAIVSPDLSKSNRLPNLTSYRSYFEHNQTLHQYDLNNILQGGQQNVIVVAEQTDAFLVNTYRFMERCDDGLKSVEIEDGSDSTPLLTNHAERFKKYVEEKEKTLSESLQNRIVTTRKSFDSESVQPTMSGVIRHSGNDTVDIDKTIVRLEKGREEADAKGEATDSRKLLALAILYKQKNETIKAIEMLDAMKLTSSADIRYREQLVLKWFPGQTDNAGFKKRTETAIQKLAGYQLKSDELKDMRQAYRLLGKTEEADRLRDRLMVAATDLNTQYELLDELRNEQRTEDGKAKAARFALKVFRSPAVRNAASGRQENMAWHVRSRTLEVLKNAGKLGEIVDQIEAQWKSAPGSLDIMTALADVYQKAGRAEDAKKIAREMADKIPDDAAKMQNYANLLRNVGMNAESAEWMQKVIAKTPEQLLSNFWQYENSFRDSKQTKKLIELLRKIKPQRLAAEFGQIGYRFSEWTRNDETKVAADALLKYIWEMDGVTDNELWRLRSDFIRQLSHNSPGEDFYPMFHDVIMRTLTPGDEGNSVPLNNNNNNPMSVSAWSSTSVYSVSVTFFDLAEKKNCLDETRKEFQQLLSEKYSDDSAKADQSQRYRLTRMFLAMNEIRLKNAAKAIEIIESLDMTKPSASVPNRFNNEERLVIGLELAKLDDSKAIDTAIKLFESEMKLNQDSHSQQVILVPLYKLYLKSQRADEGRKLASDKICECFKFLRLAGSNHHYQVGNRHHSVWQLQETVVALSRAMLEAGYAFDLMLVYRQDYDGQAWVSVARTNNDYRYREMDKISQELEGKIGERDFVRHLDRMIPDPARIDKENSNEKPNSEEPDGFEAKLPLMLGAYIDSVKGHAGLGGNRPFGNIRQGGAADLIAMFKEIKDYDDLPNLKDDAASGDSPVGIRFADALRVISKDKPDEYIKLKQKLDVLADSSPDDPTILVVLSCCALIDGNQPTSISLLQRCADWVRNNGDSDALTEPIALGFWTVLKGVFEHKDWLSDGQTGRQILDDCKAIYPVVGKLIGKLSVRKSGSDSDSQSNDRLYTVLFDVQRKTPKNLLSEFRPDFDGMILEQLLLPEPGRLTRSLETRRLRIASQLCDSIALGATRPVMLVFEKTFQNGWPMKEGTGSQLARTDSMYLLGIVDKVLDAARKSNVDAKPIFDSLLKIVLPLDATKPSFLGIYSDLGGKNGYFRTPAADLVDWAIAADQVEALKQRLEEKRKQEIVQKPENTTALDAVELILSIKTGDEKRTEQLKSLFRERIEKNDVIGERMILVAAMPCIKDSEFAELSERPYADLVDLVDAALDKGDKDNRNRRYSYYIIRSLYAQFSQDAELSKRIRWLIRYRKITEPNQMDGFRFTAEDRLYHEGMQSIDDGKLPDALAILQYFAACPVDQFRYRDLSDYLDRLQVKLDALPESQRKEWLGDFDLSKVARQSNVKREQVDKSRLIAPDYDLPPLPEGSVVYQNDFELQTGPEWSVDRRDTIRKIEQTFLGEFHSEKLRFRLDRLPKHRLVRIRFDLLMFGGADGLVGYESEFGVDVWGMTVNKTRRPIVSTFSNFRKDSYNQKQSFPDDYPPEFGITPTWYGKVLDGSIWNDELEKGYYCGRESAVLHNKFGYEKDAAYAVDLIVPHDATELEIEFFTKFRDGPYGGGAVNLSFGESWGLDNFSVELIDKELELDQAALTKCFEALIGDDAAKAAAARWRLVAAGDASVKLIADWFNVDHDGSDVTSGNASQKRVAKAEEIRKTGNFDLFRIQRVLQLIGTADAEATIKDLLP